ncbi:hypothetical protein [Pyrobaculum sp.]|uniref:hypothetical protein n=1 Tax=Pyrobaculum sp. TaxID=2004705 RepID=UPI003D12398C
MAVYRVLIVGDVGRGKTLLLAKMLKALAALGVSVTILDFAPEKMGVGAKLTRYVDVAGVRYLTEVFRAPRLEGRDAGEELALARENAERAAALIRQFLASPTPVLAVNDLTIYLHAGDPALVEEAIDAADVFIATAYYGSALRDKGSGISGRERRAVEELMKRCDVFRL